MRGATPHTPWQPTGSSNTVTVLRFPGELHQRRASSTEAAFNKHYTLTHVIQPLEGAQRSGRRRRDFPKCRCRHASRSRSRTSTTAHARFHAAVIQASLLLEATGGGGPVSERSMGVSPSWRLGRLDAHGRLLWVRVAAIAACTDSVGAQKMGKGPTVADWTCGLSNIVGAVRCEAAPQCPGRSVATATSFSKFQLRCFARRSSGSPSFAWAKNSADGAQPGVLTPYHPDLPSHRISVLTCWSGRLSCCAGYLHPA